MQFKEMRLTAEDEIRSGEPRQALPSRAEPSQADLLHLAGAAQVLSSDRICRL